MYGGYIIQKSIEGPENHGGCRAEITYLGDGILQPGWIVEIPWYIYGWTGENTPIYSGPAFVIVGGAQLREIDGVYKHPIHGMIQRETQYANVRNHYCVESEWDFCKTIQKWR